MRRYNVYRSARYDPAMSASILATRASPSESASTVRAPSTVSVSEAFISEYDSFSRR